MAKFLVTGGAGFIGGNFLHIMVNKYPNDDYVCLDAKFLVTGGAGFIGGNFLHIMVNKYPNDDYVCLDALTYAGNMETLEPIK